MPSVVARRAWYDGYLSTVINRDIRNFATVSHADAIARLLGLIAARAGSIAVISDLAQSVELAPPTTKDYLSYLDMVYLVTSLPAWSSNATSRLVKSPKLYPTDSGLAAHLLGVDADDLTSPGHTSLGPSWRPSSRANSAKPLPVMTNRCDFSMRDPRTDTKSISFWRVRAVASSRWK